MTFFESLGRRGDDEGWWPCLGFCSIYRFLVRNMGACDFTGIVCQYSLLRTSKSRPIVGKIPKVAQHLSINQDFY